MEISPPHFAIPLHIPLGPVRGPTSLSSPSLLLGPYHNPHSLRIQPRTRQEEIMREFDVTQVRLEEFE
jgi:hypothetical protein